MPLDEYTVHASTLTLTVVDCGPLESITNGNVMVNGGTTFNRIAIYVCNSGYHLVRMAIRICQSSGQWNGSAPRCERNCEFLLVTFIHKLYIRQLQYECSNMQRSHTGISRN